MSEENKIQFFEDKKIRTAWNESEEEWYFSIVDVISVLTDSNEPRRYWSDLKRKLKAEGANQLYENIVQLKMQSPKDGKNYKTDVANTEQLLRLIQSIPSPKAEPFKMWLAEVGRERIDETVDPELTIERALETYLKKGYSREWINQRLQAIQVRKELTAELSGMTTRQYKNLKGLKKGNLRDNMSTLELVLNMLAEATTTEISKEKNSQSFSENRSVAKEGGEVAGNARKDIEERTGKPVITAKNAVDFSNLISDVIENDFDKNK